MQSNAKTKVSRTVWWEEVNIGFLNKIKEIYGEEVQVSFRSDDDLQEGNVTYPRILVTNLYEQFDRSRLDTRDSIVVESTETTISTEKPALPYVLKIQFDLITTYLTDMNRISLLWSANFLDWDNLDVLDSSGTPRNVPIKNVFQTKSEEETEDGQRLFKRTLIYEVRVEIDETEVITGIRPHLGLQI